MIDARNAAGVPVITTCPIVVPSGFLTDLGVEFADWQEKLLATQGFIVSKDT